MDWENERYCRLYIKETIDDAVLSWQAAALWKTLLPRFDRAGVLDLGEHGWKGVAALIRWPLDVVEAAMPELLKDGRVELCGSYLVAPNYIAANEAKQSDKQRQAESRARRRDLARAQALLDRDVTNRDDTEPPTSPTLNRKIAEERALDLAEQGDVTDRDSMGSQNVTESLESVTGCHSVSLRTEPSRTSRADVDTKHDRRKKPTTPLPEDLKPADAHRKIAEERALDLAEQFERFCDWARANDRRYVDWNAAFRNWLRSSHQTPARANGSASQPYIPGGGKLKRYGDSA